MQYYFPFAYCSRATETRELNSRSISWYALRSNAVNHINWFWTTEVFLRCSKIINFSAPNSKMLTILNAPSGNIVNLMKDFYLVLFSWKFQLCYSTCHKIEFKDSVKDKISSINVLILPAEIIFQLKIWLHNFQFQNLQWTTKCYKVGPEIIQYWENKLIRTVKLGHFIYTV